MTYIPLQQLAQGMVATLIALAATATLGQDPLPSDPVPSNPILSDPILSDPVLSDPVLSDPVLSDPVLSDYQSLDAAPIVDAPTDHVYSDSDQVLSGNAPTSGSYVGDLPSAAVGVNGGTINGRSYTQPDLFYNYYSAGFANRANAQMYLSPLPVPPNVGHTFFTYQPFYPHHMLYKHKDRFHRCYDKGRGMNRTKASYYYPPIRQAACNLYWNYLRLPR